MVEKIEESGEDEEKNKQKTREIEQLYEKAAGFFSVDMGVPPKIRYREKESEEIIQYLREGIRKGGQTGILMVCGVPGIGKTLTMKSVLD